MCCSDLVDQGRSFQTPLCNRPSGTRHSWLFSPTQWKFGRPSNHRIFLFYPAIFILPQWLCGVTLKYPAYFCKRTKKQNVKITIKKQLLQKSKAIRSYTSCSSSGTESNSSLLESVDYHTRKRIFSRGTHSFKIPLHCPFSP